MLWWYTNINGLYWLKCPLWNIFLLTKFGVKDEARWSISMKNYTIICPFVDEKLSIAVRPESSGQLLPTSIDNFIAHGHNFVVITSVKQIISFKSMLRAQYVRVFIMHSEILFWWCESTTLEAMVWSAAIMLALKTIVLKAPFSTLYFLIFKPNVAAY